MCSMNLGRWDLAVTFVNEMVTIYKDEGNGLRLMVAQEYLERYNANERTDELLESMESLS